MSYNLIQGDCMEFMNGLPDNAFSLAICDPPYFSIAGSKMFPGNAVSTTGVQRHRFDSKEWSVPDQAWLDEVVRVSSNQIVWGINYMPFIHCSGRIIWDKKNDTSSFSKCEIASASMHYGVHQFRYLWNGMLQGDMKNKQIRIHPTEKPIKLYEWLLTNYAKEGDTILDTHGGSMSSVIACLNLGFDITCIEKDADYFAAAKQRIENHQKQPKMFDMPLTTTSQESLI